MQRFNDCKCSVLRCFHPEHANAGSTSPDHLLNITLITGLITPLNTPKPQQNTGDHT